MREVSDAEGRVPAELAGLDRFDARERIAELLRDAGALVKTEVHQNNVRHCYRCETVIEPRLSDQWFVKNDSRSPRPHSRPCATARSAFSPSAGRRSTSTGSRTFATGTSRGSSGGDIAFRCGTAMTAAASRS